MPTEPTRPETAPARQPVDELSYEQARDELVAVVARLEAGAESLEASLALWERGEALAARCLEWLDGARARLDGARPDAGRPGSGRPDAGRPGSGGPGAGQPDAPRPGPGQPDAARPGASGPDGERPDARSPGASGPE